MNDEERERQGLAGDIASADRFLLVCRGRPVGLFEANVSDDDSSERGWCFDYYVSKLSSNGTSWCEVDGGQYWDYETPMDLLVDILQCLAWDADAAVALSRGEFDEIVADPRLAYDTARLAVAIETVG